MKIFRFCYNPQELLPYIDWGYFYHAWGIKPSMWQSDEALGLRVEALALLSADTSTRVFSLFRLCDASSCGDNILLDGECLPLLRQQHDSAEVPNLCLSDYVSPHGDKVGLFATSVSAAFVDEDPYRKMLFQTLADRLAEAAASLLHASVRTKKELWGYSPDENFTPQELNGEPFVGIRPAVGYPSLPDQSVIFVIDKLLSIEKIGITLTANGAMHPHASVCGLMFAHPAAKYFSVGKIDEEQLRDYALRRGSSVEVMRKYLATNL